MGLDFSFWKVIVWLVFCLFSFCFCFTDNSMSLLLIVLLRFSLLHSVKIVCVFLVICSFYLVYRILKLIIVF